MLIQSQVQVPTTNALFNTAVDCLHFVTEFFEVISQSAPHIYHSALQLAPQSSIVWKLYSQQFHSPLARVVTGTPASWDLCTASTRTQEIIHHATWSPCGQFIAAGSGSSVLVRDSNTLERVSVLKPPRNLRDAHPNFLIFSPNGCLLACSYTR